MIDRFGFWIRIKKKRWRNSRKISKRKEKKDLSLFFFRSFLYFSSSFFFLNEKRNDVRDWDAKGEGKKNGRGLRFPVFRPDFIIVVINVTFSINMPLI